LGSYRAARIENFYVQLGNTGFNGGFTLHLTLHEYTCNVHHVCVYITYVFPYYVHCTAILRQESGNRISKLRTVTQGPLYIFFLENNISLINELYNTLLCPHHCPPPPTLSFHPNEHTCTPFQSLWQPHNCPLPTFHCLPYFLNA